MLKTIYRFLWPKSRDPMVVFNIEGRALIKFRFRHFQKTIRKETRLSFSTAAHGPRIISSPPTKNAHFQKRRRRRGAKVTSLRFPF